MHSLSSTPAYHIYASPERFRGTPALTDSADTCCEVGVSVSAAAADGDNANDTDAVDGSEDDEDSVSSLFRSRCTKCCTSSSRWHVNCQHLLCVESLEDNGKSSDRNNMQYRR